MELVVEVDELLDVCDEPLFRPEESLVLLLPSEELALVRDESRVLLVDDELFLVDEDWEVVDVYLRKVDFSITGGDCT